MSHSKNIGLDQKELEQYILDHSSGESEDMYQLHRKIHSKLYHPRRSSDHLSGLFLKMISQMIRPKRILEIGTFAGYGTLSLASGLSPDGIIHTIEINDELEDLILETLEKRNLKNRVQLYIGDALKIIPEFNDAFDLVFIDGEKDEYCAYFDAVIGKVKPGGFILADNVLWSGKVLEDKLPEKDHFTKGILEFNQKIQKDDRVENILLPVFDGISLIRRLGV